MKNSVRWMSGWSLSPSRFPRRLFVFLSLFLPARTRVHRATLWWGAANWTRLVDSSSWPYRFIVPQPRCAADFALNPRFYRRCLVLIFFRAILTFFLFVFYFTDILATWEYIVHCTKRNEGRGRENLEYRNFFVITCACNSAYFLGNEEQ